MEILAHRGFWQDLSEQNTSAAFERALANGYGIETDIRDLNGSLVISHDMPRTNAIRLDDLLERYTNLPTPPPLALNIKADGLCDSLQSTLRRYRVKNYFVFDMSIPETIKYLRANVPVFVRRSEFERASKLDERAVGFWLDAFETSCADPSDIFELLTKGCRVAVVSPELHGNPHLAAWGLWRNVLANLRAAAGNRLLLCTDLPDEAKAFFGA